MTSRPFHFEDDYPEVPTPFLLLFSGYVLYWYLQLGERVAVLGAIRGELIFGALLGIIAVASGIQLRSPLVGWVGAFLACLAIQVPFSSDLTTSFTVFVDRVLKFSAMALFIIAFVRGPKGLKYFLAAFFLACLKIGQEGLTGVLTGSMVWQNQGVLRLHGSTSLVSHPNSLSGNALGTLPFIWFLFPHVKWPVRAVLLLQTAFALNIILYTGSRTGWIAFIAFLVLLILKTRPKPGYLIGIVVLVLILIPLIPQEYQVRFGSVFTMKEQEGNSAETRLEIVKDAVAIFQQHPFGVGVSAFPAVRTATFGRFQDTHNLYLEVATNLGIQGLIVFGGLIITLLKVLSRNRNRLREQIAALGPIEQFNRLGAAESAARSHLQDLRLFAAACDAVWCFVIIRLVAGVFGHDLYEIYWWFSIGLAVAVFNLMPYTSRRTAELCARLAGAANGPNGGSGAAETV